MCNSINIGNLQYYFDDLSIGTTELLFCGHEKCKPGYFYGPFMRTHYLMVYVISGKGIFKSQNTIYKLKKGCTFFIFPGEITYYQADEQDPWEYVWIAFNGGIGGYDMSQFLLRASISSRRPVHIATDNFTLENLYIQLLNFCNDQKRFVDIKVISLFLDIMYQYIITGNSMDTERKISEPLPNYLDLAIEFIKFNCHKHISVSDVSEHLGITREYLCKLFKKQFNISPSKFINNYRLKNAAILLISSTQSITDIAYDMNFNDYNYFSN